MLLDLDYGLIGISRFWIPSSLTYADIDPEDQDSDFGSRFDPSLFDEVEEPPPVHIIYPRPAFNRSINSIVIKQLNLVWSFLVIVLHFNCGPR